MSFITEDFLLTNRKARQLYRTFAEREPILDYHCHLSPRDIAENRQFNNLNETITFDGFVTRFQWQF